MVKAEIVGARRVIDKLHGQFLKGKRKLELDVGYSAPYALARHEDMTRPNNKFLEEPARRLGRQMAQMVEEEVRRTRNMERGLLNAGHFLLEESQKVVPVLTGFLRDSGYVRVV